MVKEPVERWTEATSFRESKALVEAVGRLAEMRGQNISGIWRQAIRHYLKSDRLTLEEKAEIQPLLAPTLNSLTTRTRLA